MDKSPGPPAGDNPPQPKSILKKGPRGDNKTNKKVRFNDAVEEFQAASEQPQSSRRGEDVAPSTNRPEPSIPKRLDWLVGNERPAREILDWLVCAKVGKELMERGWGRGGDFSGITEITLGKINGEKLCVYKKKNGTYTITTQEKQKKYSEKKNEYELQDIDDKEKAGEVIRKILNNIDNIDWDLPKIHAIRKDGKQNGQENVSSSKVLITDNKNDVRREILESEALRTDKSSAGQPTQDMEKHWKAILPWAQTGIEISGDEETSKKRKIEEDKYKLFYGKESKNNLVEEENKFFIAYYTSDQKTRKEIKGKYIEYRKEIEEKIRNESESSDKLEDNKYNIKAEILNFLNKKLEEIKNMRQRLQEIVHPVIEGQLSKLFGDRFKEGQRKTYIKGDLYFHAGNKTISIADKKPGEGWVLVDAEEVKKIPKDVKGIQCDSKVYVIQKEGSSKEKKPKILVTDDSRLVERRIKQGWKALPGTQLGIELSSNEEKFNQQKLIHGKYEELSKDNKDIFERINLYDEVFGKFYWNLSEEPRKRYEGSYQRLMNISKCDQNSIKNVPNKFKGYLVEWINFDENLSVSLKNDLLGKLGALEESTSRSSQEKTLLQPAGDARGATGREGNGSVAKGKGLTSKAGKIHLEEKVANLPEGAEGKKETSGTPKENVANGSTSEVQSREQNEEVEKSVKADRPPLSPEALKERIEEEIAVTLAYYDLLSHAKKQPPEAIDKRLTPKEIKNIKIEGLTSEQRKDFLEKILEFNKTLRGEAESLVSYNNQDNTKQDINEKDLNPFQLALKDAIKTTEECNSFANTWRKFYEPSFDFTESWLVESMSDKGIKPQTIETSLKRFYGNQTVSSILNRLSEARKGLAGYEKDIDIEECPDTDNLAYNLAYKFQREELVDTYDQLIRASANLKDISDKLNKLKDGIPALNRLGRIKDLEVLYTPIMKGNNCLIHSLIGASNPGLLRLAASNAQREQLWKSVIDAIAQVVREKLKNKFPQNGKLPEEMNQDDINKLHTGGFLSTKFVPEVVNILASLQCIAPQPVLIYEWDRKNHNLKPPQYIKDSNYYAILNETEWHFNAMAKNSDKQMFEGVKKYAIAAGCLNKDGTWNDKWKGLTPEVEKKLVAQIKQDLERYRLEKSKTGGAGQ